MTPVSYEVREPILQVQNVSMSRGGVPILRDLTMDVMDLYRPGFTMGQVVGLLGPSGMGKTTLFRILAGLDQPDSGTVLIQKKPAQRGMVGVVAQHYPLFKHRTVLGNLLVAPCADVKQKSLEMLERFGLAEHAAKYPVQLSGGQRQRLAIIQQFLCSDTLLLMDEPFSGLDLLAIEKVTTFINEIMKTDEMKTIVVVTHDVAAALAVCDTVFLLGRDRDAQGNPIPGARIQARFNLIDRGLAWQDQPTVNSPQFFEVLKEIRELFPKM